MDSFSEVLKQRSLLRTDPEYKKSVFSLDKLVNGSVWGAIAGVGYAMYRGKPLMQSAMIGATIGGVLLYTVSK